MANATDVPQTIGVPLLLRVKAELDGIDELAAAWECVSVSEAMFWKILRNRFSESKVTTTEVPYDEAIFTSENELRDLLSKLVAAAKDAHDNTASVTEILHSLSSNRNRQHADVVSAKKHIIQEKSNESGQKDDEEQNIREKPSACWGAWWCSIK